MEQVATALLVAYAALAPVVPPVAVGKLFVGPLDVLFPLCVLALFTLEGGWRFPPFVFSLLSLAGLAGVSLVAVRSSRAQFECGLRVVRLLETIAPLLLACRLGGRRPGALKAAVYAFGVSGLLSALTGFVLFALQVQVRLALQKTVYGNGEYLYRAGGIFGDSSAFGHLVATWFCAMVLFLPLYLSPGAVRALLPVLAAVAGYAIYTSSSRSCVVDVAAVLALCFVVKAPAAWRRGAKAAGPVLLVLAGVAAVAVLLGAVGGLGLAAAQMSERFIQTTAKVFTDPSEASAGRTDLWSQYYQLFLDSPVIGIGYKAISMRLDLPPDNNFVAIAVETGAFGLAALALTYWLLLRHFRAGARLGSAAAWALGVLWAGQLAHSFLVDVWTFWGSMPVVMVLTGLACGTFETAGAPAPRPASGPPRPPAGPPRRRKWSDLPPAAHPAPHGTTALADAAAG